MAGWLAGLMAGWLLYLLCLLTALLCFACLSAHLLCLDIWRFALALLDSFCFALLSGIFALLLDFPSSAELGSLRQLEFTLMVCLLGSLARVLRSFAHDSLFNSFEVQFFTETAILLWCFEVELDSLGGLSKRVTLKFSWQPPNFMTIFNPQDFRLGGEGTRFR